MAIWCIRQLQPGLQFERGPVFFLYAGSVVTTAAGMVLLLTGQSSSTTVLMLALALWAMLLSGSLLVAPFGVEEDEAEAAPQVPQEKPKLRPPLPPEVAESLARAIGESPHGWQDSDSVPLPSGQNWHVPVGKADHDNAKG